jgi:asparagine synthase (glutamine-hydrolysing)
MLVSKLARREVTVALTGDGGDELFLGYGAYEWANRLDNNFLQVFRNPLIRLLNNSGNSRLKRISHLFEKVQPRHLRSHIFSQEQYFFTQGEIKNNLLTGTLEEDFSYSDPDVQDLKPAELQALFDIHYYLKDDLLVKADRASMHYALECRSPLLDHHIIEYALSLPYHFKKRGNVKKWILKEILKDYLPRELIYRPKWGFSIPLLKWLKNELHYLIEDYLNKEVIENAGIVRYSYVDQLKKSFYKGDDYLYNRLWVLIVLHKWLKNNEV